METIFVVDLIELYSIIIGAIVLGIIVLGYLLYWLYDEHLRYLFYRLKRKFKKV